MIKFGSSNVGQTGCVCFSQCMNGLKQTGQPSALTHPDVVLNQLNIRLPTAKLVLVVNCLFVLCIWRGQIIGYS